LSVSNPGILFPTPIDQEAVWAVYCIGMFGARGKEIMPLLVVKPIPQFYNV
jgi:hypothetical protein